ncbi:hypothetical protein V6N13_138462 [Hibiscus sabdariffa]|uniref:Uncharacterized protein n=1 Tax=Hibiscus sabdariffa TaxID=183260 RepID=A0ABR2QDL9_9ROSI
MQQTESTPKVGINGRAGRRVPASEIVKRKASATKKVEKVDVVQWVKNGVSIDMRNDSLSLVKKPMSRVCKELPSLEELKLLPLDESFSWTNENYSTLQRTIDDL